MKSSWIWALAGALRKGEPPLCGETYRLTHKNSKFLLLTWFLLSSGSWCAIPTAGTGRMAEDIKSMSMGGYYRPDGSPCIKECPGGERYSLYLQLNDSVAECLIMTCSTDGLFKVDRHERALQSHGCYTAPGGSTTNAPLPCPRGGKMNSVVEHTLLVHLVSPH